LAADFTNTFAIGNFPMVLVIQKNQVAPVTPVQEACQAEA
jgi:hypothetical protein